MHATVARSRAGNDCRILGRNSVHTRRTTGMISMLPAIRSAAGKIRFHVRLNVGTSVPGDGWPPMATWRLTDDQDQDSRRGCYSFCRHRRSCVGSGVWRGRAGNSLRFGAGALAVPKQKLSSRAGFRLSVPRTTLRLECRPGQVEGGWPGAIVPAFGKLSEGRKPQF